MVPNLKFNNCKSPTFCKLKGLGAMKHLLHVLQEQSL